MGAEDMQTEIKQGFSFPMVPNEVGEINAIGGDDRIRSKILQVLLTAPGERVHQPEFGCGLLNLVFEPNSSVLSAAVHFTIGQALSRWLSDEIVTDAVNVDAQDEYVIVEIVYTRTRDLKQQVVRIQFK